jgi:Reverse transcriptase (RNA-dependent DNA polymerase)
MSLDKARHQKSGQTELPLTGGGEASGQQRSGEAGSAASGNGCSGSDHLMEAVVEHGNLKRALKRVKGNKGSPGADGMTVEELPAHLQANWEKLRAQLLDGSYQPQAVRQHEIPKAGGGARKLGIPTVVDRFIQQAILQVLGPRFDSTFSEYSYGFRPGRRAHGAICTAQRFIQEGRNWVVDVDLEQFFDRVNHDVLMGKLSKRLADRRLLGLIRRFLEAGVLVNGIAMERCEGTPQGGPLSPLLANVLLDEVDKELEKRGHAFVRYADGMPEQTMDKRVRVPPPQLLIRGSSSEAASVGDHRGQVPRHRPQEVAAERQAVAKANPHVSLVIRTSGGRPSRLLGKAATSREAMGTSTVMAPPGFQGRHVAKIHGSKSGRSGRAVARVAATADAYKTDRRNGGGVRPEVGGARSTCADADNTTASTVKLDGGREAAGRREAFAQGRGPAFINALEAASGL